ncbi:MAG: polyribonucleotide nucleotidyltransferase [Planctomycetota bacterium]
MTVVSERVELGGRELRFEVGAVARQASGAVLVHEGDTVLLGVVTADKKPSALDYMPLTTEYRQKLAAGGRIPGSYNRRESRPTELETLLSRLIDRSVRPFFPDAWRADTQLVIHPLSVDPESDLSVLSIAAGVAALVVSDLPWSVPLAGVRVVRAGGELLAFPAASARRGADLDLIVSSSPEGIVMVEGGGREVPEALVLEALSLAQEAGRPLQDALRRLRAAAGKPERELPAPAEDPARAARAAELAARLREPVRAGLAVVTKLERYAALDAVIQGALAAVDPADDAERKLVREVFEELKASEVRAGVLAGRRLGGRGPEDIRAIESRVGWLPRAHGSSLFTRGETQAIVTCTLGSARDAQEIETVRGVTRQRFLLHYNFPPFSVGEARPMRGPGRREIGHGHLARRALLGVLPDEATFPYTIRLESTITESNGSSSMASVCGGSLALCDAGVPIPRPVAGIAMGLVKEGDQVVVLSDILGDEDHVGDMDFKVAGTSEGVTAIQLDNKVGALPLAVMEQALAQARAGRLHILGEMARALAAPRGELSAHAPKVETLRIHPGRIRTLIGSGGSTINGIREEFGVEIDVEDDGLVKVRGTEPAGLAGARARIVDLTGLPVVGEPIEGRVVAVKHFGSFVRLFEGIEGLLAGEQLRLGGAVSVKVTGVNEDGKLVIARA